jgi:hypothetical protein
LVPLSITFARLEERNRGMFAIIVFWYLLFPFLNSFLAE